jgi:hypothetical protein
MPFSDLRSWLQPAMTISAVLLSGALQAAAASGCDNLPNQSDFRAALIAGNKSINLSLNNQMWGTIVANDGTVCAVAFTGDDNLQSQWLASRVISAQKANTANSLSLGKNAGGANAGMALSSANLWAPTQPGGSLFGLQFSNPVDPKVAYKGKQDRFGTAKDPMVGKRIGGINVFGGGLALYDAKGNRLGGIGVSGDTSCRDHMVAWETRHNLGLDHVAAGVSGDNARPDNIIFDVSNAFGHNTCMDAAAERKAAAALTPVPAKK